MIQVKGCRLLIRPFKLQEHDKVFASAKRAGLILTEMSERKEQTLVDKGTVLEIGSKCHQDYVEGLEVGDVIGFAKFGGKFISDPETEEVFLVISDEDVVCVFKETK